MESQQVGQPHSRAVESEQVDQPHARAVESEQVDQPHSRAVESQRVDQQYSRADPCLGVVGQHKANYAGGGEAGGANNIIRC